MAARSSSRTLPELTYSILMEARSRTASTCLGCREHVRLCFPCQHLASPAGAKVAATAASAAESNDCGSWPRGGGGASGGGGGSAANSVQ
eukprot:NODE_19578_length_837_cov_2.097183.p3 GENE.NODE_19578_length_837_cov_2.097183~~NODE_19578_length_837_cov_2.097183.p3  ORF type:complete len:90 (+),score=16.97 NODE_19578_length_837_cov_2.097183:265-534(+)